MKHLKVSIVIFLLLSIIKVHGQTEPKTIFEVRIFKSVDGDFKNRKFILIDSLGNILSFNKSTGEKVNLKKFNKAIAQFVKTEPDVKKNPASDDSSPLTVVPGTGKYSLEVRIIFLEDYRTETTKKSKTNYYWSSLSNEDKLNTFLKFFSKEDTAILSKHLK